MGSAGEAQRPAWGPLQVVGRSCRSARLGVRWRDAAPGSGSAAGGWGGELVEHVFMFGVCTPGRNRCKLGVRNTVVDMMRMSRDAPYPARLAGVLMHPGYRRQRPAWQQLMHLPCLPQALAPPGGQGSIKIQIIQILNNKQTRDHLARMSNQNKWGSAYHRKLRRADIWSRGGP